MGNAHSLARPVRRAILLGSVLLLLAALARLALPWVGQFLVVSDPLARADAIVLLAGDENERLEGGARLFRQGYAEWLVLTDMRLEKPGLEGFYVANVRRKAIELGLPAGRILTVPGLVSTTDEEAARLRDFAARQGFRSLIVVTSPYHTRRARWLLREAFRGSAITLIIRSTPAYFYPADTWWRDPFYRRMTLLEYAKMLGHLVGCRTQADCGPLPWTPQAPRR